MRYTHKPTGKVALGRLPAPPLVGVPENKPLSFWEEGPESSWSLPSCPACGLGALRWAEDVYSSGHRICSSAMCRRHFIVSVVRDARGRDKNCCTYLRRLPRPYYQTIRGK